MSVTRHRRARNGLVSPNQGLGEVCGNHPKSHSPLHRQTLPTPSVAQFNYSHVEKVPKCLNENGVLWWEEERAAMPQAAFTLL